MWITQKNVKAFVLSKIAFSMLLYIILLYNSNKLTVCSSHVIHTFYSESRICILQSALNDWVSVYKLNGCGFGSSCNHLNKLLQKLNNAAELRNLLVSVILD